MGEIEGGKYQCVVASPAPPVWDLARNPGLCPAWEWNWRPLGSQAVAQSSEPRQPGQGGVFKARKGRCIFRIISPCKVPGSQQTSHKQV